MERGLRTKKSVMSLLSRRRTALFVAPLRVVVQPFGAVVASLPHPSWYANGPLPYFVRPLSPRLSISSGAYIRELLNSTYVSDAPVFGWISVMSFGVYPRLTSLGSGMKSVPVISSFQKSSVSPELYVRRLGSPVAPAVMWSGTRLASPRTLSFVSTEASNQIPGIPTSPTNSAPFRAGSTKLARATAQRRSGGGEPRVAWTRGGGRVGVTRDGGREGARAQPKARASASRSDRRRTVR